MPRRKNSWSLWFAGEAVSRCHEWQPLDPSPRLQTAAMAPAKRRQVRDALGVHEGDSLIFRVEGYRAVMAASPDLLDLAGVVSVPATRRSTPWDEVRHEVRRWRPV